MPWNKAVVTSNAHLHAFAGSPANLTIYAGMFGRTGPKLKPGDVVEVDPTITGTADGVPWMLGRYQGEYGFIRSAKVFVCMMYAPIHPDDVATHEQVMAAEVAAGRVRYVRAGASSKECLSYGYSSDLYFRNVFASSGIGTSVYRDARSATGWIDPALPQNENNTRQTWQATADQKQAAWNLQGPAAYNAFDALQPIPGFDAMAVGAQIDALLAANPSGFIIAEDHKDPAPKRILIANMARLAARGVRVIYLEHLLHTPFQVLFDLHFFNGQYTGHVALLVASLDRTFLAGRPATENIAGLVQAAQQHGIRIVLVDDVGAMTNTYTEANGGEKRVRRMNFKTEEIFRADQAAHASSWVMLLGKKHVQTQPGQVPGLPQLLGVPGVELTDDKTRFIGVDDLDDNRLPSVLPPPPLPPPSDDDEDDDDDSPPPPPSDMTPYAAKSGECITTIAFAHGFLPASLWDHPSNASLKKLRGDGAILFEGDVVNVPTRSDKSVAAPTGQTHTFRRKGVPAKFHVQLLNVKKPRANVKFWISFDDGGETEGTTDGDGNVDVFMPPSAQEAVVRLESGFRFLFRLGGLDPVTKESGARQRLRHLGYLDGSSKVSDDDYEIALRAFQTDHGVDVTGELDEATQDALKKAHDQRS